MGTFNGNAQGGRFAAGSAKKHKRHAGAGVQLVLSLFLLLDLFLLYTIIMQLTHQQKAFEASRGFNLILLGILAVGAVALLYAVIRTRAWKRALCLLLIFAILYLIIVFSDLPLVKKYREMWISTAWSTMRHQGLATYYFPASVVESVTGREAAGRDAQVGINTGDLALVEAQREEWLRDPEKGTGLAEQDKEFGSLTDEQKRFYGLFYELDRDSTEAYFQEHPDILENGYEHILINESSLGSSGTPLRTKLGEKVLAIDAANQILLLEVDCDGSRGVLAVAKDNERLHLYPAAHVGEEGGYGEVAGSIAKRNGGILAMTGSGFIDVDANGVSGNGNGGQIAGWAMCSNGKTYGEHYSWGYKRMELHEDNWFYIRDCFDSVSSGTTDAMEFTPGLIINGNKLDPGIWTSQNPRASIGQSIRGEILMLCVEGRSLSSPGCSVEVCAEVLLQHDGLTALNCDGGTTAIMWYRGEPVMRCSNTAIPNGRYLPNAWVYLGE